MHITTREIKPIWRRAFLATLLFSLLVVQLPVNPLAAQGPDGSGPAPLPPVPQTDPFFGIVQSIHDPDKAVAAGVTWERLVVWWSRFQPDSQLDWKSDAWFPRNLISDQKNRGIEPVGVILHTPQWAAGEALGDGWYAIAPPLHIDDKPFDDPENYWGQFLMRLAGEYAGLVDTWILWNEPDIYADGYANWAGTVEQFAQMQMVGYQAIKKANPQAKVLLTGTTYWWDKGQNREQYLDKLVALLANAPGAEENNAYFDAVSVHQYSSPLNSYTVPMLYKRILAKHGLGEKPIWINESNVVPHDDPIHSLHRGGLRASMEEQSNYMIQSVALARAAGVERYAVYKMLDEDPENEQYYGLVRNNGTVRPAYVAYQLAVREMSNVRDAQYFWSNAASPPTRDEVTALLSSSNHQPQFIWPGALNGVRMKRGADRVTVLWNASAAPLPVMIPSSASNATVMNKYGEAQPLTRGADGTFRLTLAAATNNTDARDPSLILVGGDPVILVEPGAANARDAFPRPVDACAGVPGAFVPLNPTSAEAWVAPTGYAVSGPWLDFFRSHGDVDYIGYPRSPVVTDPLNPNQCVQYFQRLVLEWHPDNPAEYRIQRRLLTTELSNEGVAPEEPPAGPNSPDYWYFPKGENGLGHAVTNIAPDGAEIGFKTYFDTHGKEDAFGYPMEPPVMRVGPDGTARWTQRFQAAIFEYHPEFDKDGLKPGTDLPWRTWTVQLQLLGDEYLKVRPLPFVVGDPAQHVSLPPTPAPAGGQ